MKGTTDKPVCEVMEEMFLQMEVHTVNLMLYRCNTCSKLVKLLGIRLKVAFCVVALTEYMDFSPFLSYFNSGTVRSD